MEASKAYLTVDERHVLKRFRDDFWTFATACLHTVDEHESNSALKMAKPWPRYDYLKDTAKQFEENRLCIVLKPRQMLLSWLGCAFMLHRVLFNPGERWLAVSKREKDAYHLKDRTVSLLENLPDVIREMLDHRRTDNSGELEFVGGSAIHFLPASPAIGRTFTGSGLLLDEFAFHPWDREMFTSLYPTVADGGRCLAISTPNGVGNQFHELWVKAGERGFHKIALDWSDHPDHTSELFETVTAPFSKRQIAQEYGCSFLQSGATVFEQEHLKIGCAPMSDDLRAAIITAARRDRDPSPFLIGVDTSEGGEDADLQVAQVLRKDTGEQCEVLAGRWRPDVFAAKLVDLCARYPDGPIGVEKASSGGTVLLELERAGLGERLYRHREFDQRGRAKTKLGWVTSSKSKPVMIDELESAIRQGDLKICDQATLDELLVYEYKDTSEHSGAPSGFHDDRVMALAVAWQMRKNAGRGARTIG